MRSALPFVLAMLVGCGGTSEPSLGADAAVDARGDVSDGADTSEAGDSDANADVDCSDAPVVPARDCTKGVCGAFAPTGDAPAIVAPASFFHGFADPSVREDPLTHRLWVAYSWPHETSAASGGATVVVDAVATHYAHSDDSGGSWQADGTLWPEVPVADPGGSGRQGYFSSEAPSLAPALVDGELSWYSARLTYFLPPVAGFAPDATTFTIHVAHAETVAGLATAKEQRLGTKTSASVSDVDLGALSGTLRSCAFFNDPAVFFDGGKLYLAVECLVYSGGKPIDAEEKVVLFSTVPEPDIAESTWRYVGVLADHALANELGDEELMQVDLVRGDDGAMVTLLTPSHATAKGGQFHQGCRALELASLDPPIVARRCGVPLVRAIAKTSDVPSGSGACGYDPASKTGLLVARRPDDTQVFTIVQSGLRL